MHDDHWTLLIGNKKGIWHLKFDGRVYKPIKRYLWLVISIALFASPEFLVKLVAHITGVD